MHIQTEGLVLREVQIGEADKLLTILTRQMGLVSALARGAKRKGSRLTGCAQLLTYARFTLFESKDKYTIDEAECIDFFIGLRSDIELLSLGSYFVQLLQMLADEGVGDERLLNLTLNCLYALSHLEKPQELVKPVFELMALSISGFEPLVGECVICGEENPERPGLNLSEGVLCCEGCRSEIETGIWVPLTAGALGAMRHVLYGPPNRIFSFSLDSQSAQCFQSVCEAFLLSQTGHGYKALDFYKSLKVSQQDTAQK